jgi:hypothetical protein
MNTSKINSEITHGNFGLERVLKEMVGELNFGFGSGNTYYAIQATDSIYGEFYKKYFEKFDDGSVSIYNTIQGALDATVANRGDTVVIMGGWTITDTLSVDRKYGLRITGENPFGEFTGGPAEITYNGVGVAFTLSSPKTILSDLTFYMGGTPMTTNTVCLDISQRVFSHSVIRNVNIRKTGGTDAQGHAIRAGSPSSSTFEDIMITSASGNANRWQTGILATGDDLCHYKNLWIGGTEGFAIYNPGTKQSLYEKIFVMPSCNDGLTLTGVTSAIVDSRDMAAAEGTNTVIKSQSFTTGTTAMT